MQKGEERNRPALISSWLGDEMISGSGPGGGGVVLEHQRLENLADRCCQQQGTGITQGMGDTVKKTKQRALWLVRDSYRRSMRTMSHGRARRRIGDRWNHSFSVRRAGTAPDASSPFLEMGGVEDTRQGPTSDFSGIFSAASRGEVFEPCDRKVHSLPSQVSGFAWHLVRTLATRNG